MVILINIPVENIHTPTPPKMSRRIRMLGRQSISVWQLLILVLSIPLLLIYRDMIALLQEKSENEEKMTMMLVPKAITRLTSAQTEAQIADIKLPVSGTEGALPSWAIATQCSIYHVDCPNHLTFEEYPFPLHWKSVRSIPMKWIDEFKKDVLLKPVAPETEGKTISMAASSLDVEQPSKVTDLEKEKCLQDTKNLSIEDQLDNILKRLHPLDDTQNMIAFSMTDENYASDMLHEVFEMNSEVVGFSGAFFFVSMDTFTNNMACEFGYPVMAMPDNEDLKKQVQSTKAFISKLLVERGQSFFFYEMDVWFIRSPLRMLQQMKADFLCSSHQWNPMELNIGFYAAIASQGTINYFQDCLDIIEKKPLAHDQKIMHVIARDNGAALNNQTIDDHFNCKWCGHENVSFPATNVTHPIRVDLIDPHIVVSSMFPVPTEQTVAIHLLADTPLQGPHGKQMVAKELGAWFGSGKRLGGGYYHREGKHRRFLFLENPGVRGGHSMSQRQVYHSKRALKNIFAILVTLAKQSNRILVLPQVLGDFFAQPVWLYSDLESVEKIGVRYRETNFAFNKKSWYSPTKPFESVSQMAIDLSSKEIHLQTMKGDNYNNVNSTAWKIPPSVFEEDPFSADAFFAMATVHPGVGKSEALFVNIGDFAYIQRSRSFASKEIQAVYDSLLWCENGSKNGRDIPASKAGPTSHCYGKGVSSEWNE